MPNTVLGDSDISVNRKDKESLIPKFILNLQVVREVWNSVIGSGWKQEFRS